MDAAVVAQLLHQRGISGVQHEHACGGHQDALVGGQGARLGPLGAHRLGTGSPAQPDVALEVHLRALREAEHRPELGVGAAFLLVVGEGADDVGVDGAALVVDEGHAGVQLVEGEAGLDAEAVGAVGARDLGPERVRLAVYGLGHLPASVEEAQGYERRLVAGVPEASFAARDHVEFVVG